MGELLHPSSCYFLFYGIALVMSNTMEKLLIEVSVFKGKNQNERLGNLKKCLEISLVFFNQTVVVSAAEPE